MAYEELQLGERASNLGAYVECPEQQAPGKLALYSDEISRTISRLQSLSNRVEAFLDRCNGPSPQSGSTGSSAVAPKPPGHIAEIEGRFSYLSEVIDRLDRLTADLSNIG